MAEKPILGVALGSGSARGWAHVGVLQALDDLGLRPDVVTGCSVGAMVGAAWAARRLDPFEGWARSLTRRDVFNFLDFTVGGSLVKGDRLYQLFDRWSDLCIEGLPRSFAAVATDLETGERLCFREGRVVDVVRASMAMPGLFPAVHYDGRWLVDGALVDPIPVVLCRELGAERVIAVNLNHGIVADRSSRGLAARPAGPEPASLESSPAVPGPGIGFGERVADRLEELRRRLASWSADEDAVEPPGLFDVLVGALHILQDRVTRITLERYPPDLELRPRLGDIGLLEVFRADESIAEGRRVVEAAAESIRQLID